MQLQYSFVKKKIEKTLRADVMPAQVQNCCTSVMKHPHVMIDCHDVIGLMVDFTEGFTRNQEKDVDAGDDEGDRELVPVAQIASPVH